MKIILLNNATTITSDNNLDSAKLKSIFNDMANTITCTDIFSLFIRLLFDKNDRLDYSGNYISYNRNKCFMPCHYVNHGSFWKKGNIREKIIKKVKKTL